MTRYILFAGTAALAILAGTSAQARKDQVLYSFQAGADQAFPAAGVVADDAGNLYGTTSGAGVDCNSGCGTVFKLAPDGTLTNLHVFGGADGAFPQGGLIRDKAGNLYGTTSSGGANNQGVVFAIYTDGTETVLHSFVGGGAEGALPVGTLFMDGRGILYGTTFLGGASNCGTVFTIPQRGFQTLYFFNGSDGCNPFAGVIGDRSGTLYGTTLSGGDAQNQGTVYRIEPDGSEAVLLAFSGSNGQRPSSGLVQDEAGNLYGTTASGGNFGNGVVFQLAPDGSSQNILHHFGGGTDGATPSAGVVLSKDGEFYGTTEAGGGTCNCGTVFELTPEGSETILHAFASYRKGDGDTPQGGAIAVRGTLYGTTLYGGSGALCRGCGTVFAVKK